MLNNVLTHKDLVKPLAARSGGSLEQARRFLTATTTLLADTLRAGQSVHLKGLGRFEWVATLERPRRNPGTGEPVIVPAGRRLRFKPSRSLNHRGDRA